MALADQLLWLCNIPSLIGEEAALCDALQARLAQVKLAAPIRRYGNSLVVALERGHATPTLVLGGHLDVVRTEHDGGVRIDGNRLYAPGASDMKSGLALMLALAEAQPRPRLNLTLVFYAREEGPFAENELGPVLEQDPELRNSHFAVMLEPSDNKLQLGCGGSLHATVRFSGKTAHSARPWQGENAVYKAIPLLEKLAALKPEPVRVDGLEWNRVTTCTLAKAGRGRNIVPDSFELNLNHRFAPGTDPAGAQAYLRELVGPNADVEFIDVSPAALPYRSHPWVQALAAAGAVAVEPKQAWTDVARFALLGIPAVNFGPGVQAQAHQKNEWTDLAALEFGNVILRRWLERMSSSSGEQAER